MLVLFIVYDIVYYVCEQWFSVAQDNIWNKINILIKQF